MGELRVVVAGAGGRMGRTLARAVLSEPKMRLIGALDQPESDVQGKDAGQLAGVQPCGVLVSSDPLPAFANTDVVLDFTAPAATLFYAELAAQAPFGGNGRRLALAGSSSPRSNVVERP